MFRPFILGALLYSSKCFITTQHGTTEALSLQIIAQRFSSTFGVPHTKLQQRGRACSWAGVHVEVRRACPVREELAAGLTAAQGYGAPLRLGRRGVENFCLSPEAPCMGAAEIQNRVRRSNRNSVGQIPFDNTRTRARVNW